jgi:hypothetical protein
MFTKGFDRYACDGESITCEVDGFKVRATIKHDDHGDAPWDNDCGHGPVSDWTSRNKRPGERVLSVADRGGSRRFYDFAEAVRLARKDGWDTPPYQTGTPGQRAARAAERDFEVLRAWCRDDWWYVGIVVSVVRDGIKLGSASLWGVECNYPGANNAYLLEVANELLPEALDEARKAIAKLCACHGEA